jgi:hypothetical protein
MSEANNIPPDGLSGPASRPDGNGLPQVDGGRSQPGGRDAVDPGSVEGDGDRGTDVPGMAGEG